MGAQSDRATKLVLRHTKGLLCSNRQGGRESRVKMRWQASYRPSIHFGALRKTPEHDLRTTKLT
jgi:hypothetical protein